MNINEVFHRLLELAETSKDPEGVVSACLVHNGEVICESASSDDSQYHAEYLVIKRAVEANININEDMILFTTLEPCSDFSDINDGEDCTTWIIKSGIKSIIYGASDPEFSTEAKERFEQEGINCKQIDDKDMIQKCRELFNSTIKVDLDKMKLSREDKL